MELEIIIGISVLLFTGVITFNRLFLKTRISRYLEKERGKKDEFSQLRKEMARDFHDEMGNHLASVISLVNVLKLRLTESDNQVQSILGKIETASKSLFEGSREFMWTIDPDHDNLEDILIYLRDYGVEYFRDTEIEFEVGKELLFNAKAIQILPGTSRHIIAIFKEAMTNSLKHSLAQKVSFESKYNDEDFTVWIADNGLGLMGSMGRGLKNMQIRALKINAYLKLQTLDQGFKVELKFCNP